MTREIWNMNHGWRFHYGDVDKRNFAAFHEVHYKQAQWLKVGNDGMSKVGYPDDDWRDVNLPHDYVVETGFSSDDNLTHGSRKVDIAWYRKTFRLPKEDEQKRIFLEFDGVFRDCEIWMNGNFVGRHISGYTSFQFDVTELCEFDALNSIAIRCDATVFELWSYEGGGIYRDVRLVKKHQIYVPTWGVHAQPEPNEQGGGCVDIVVDVKNMHAQNQLVDVQCELIDKTGSVLASATEELAISWEETGQASLHLSADQIDRWHVGKPNLYTLRTTVTHVGETVDVDEIKIGFRTVNFDPKTGFYLNGENMKMLGVCNHQDHAGVGIAIPYELERWRLKRMQEMGVNAIRTAHNPATPQMLDLCNEMGIMVMDEARQVGASDEFLNQLESLIKRGRNHPSIVMWSLGNEEMMVQERPVGMKQLQRMQNLAHRLDTTRKCTYAMNCDWSEISIDHDKFGFRLDVFGTNYCSPEQRVATGTLYDKFHKNFPDWPLLGTETGGSASTRGLYHAEPEEAALHYEDPVWKNPERTNLVSAYSEMCTPWGSTIEETWKDCAERPFLAGTFLWTGFDYRGETYPCGFPSVITRYGLMDLCGFPKDAYFYYKAWWLPKEPILHILPHWNWEGSEGKEIDVWAYSNCEEVELILNGESQGRQKLERNSYLTWKVPYAAGALEAFGYDKDGKQELHTLVETTGEPASIRLETERSEMQADGADIIPVAVIVCDAEGREVRTADNLITFEISGAGELAGTGNGNPLSHEPEQEPERKAYHGRCQVLVRASREAGKLSLKAASGDLKSDEVTFDVKTSPAANIVEAEYPEDGTVVKVETAVDNAL